MTAWVLGCHRSGTSLLCSVLRTLSSAHREQLLGPDMPANPANPAGYHESASLVEVNERLLGWAGCTWDRPFVARPAWAAPDSIALIARLRGSLSSHTGNVDWIDKDPRLCLTRDAFAYLLLLRDPDSIAIMRDPLAVATSLHRRNGFSFRKGAAIWLLYNLHLFNSHSRPPHTVLLFDDLVSTDKQVQLRVSRDLAGFSVAASSAEPDTATAELEERALAELKALRRYELVRSGGNQWHDSDSQLATTLEDLWVGCQAIVRGDSDQQMATYLRHAWATLSPTLEGEVAIPLHEQQGFGERIARSLSSLRGRLPQPTPRGLAGGHTEFTRALGHGSSTTDPGFHRRLR